MATLERLGIYSLAFTSNCCKRQCAGWFLLTWHKLESCGRREPQLRKCLIRLVSLWACQLIIFLIVDWCARIQPRVGSATSRQVVQGSTRKVQERWLNVGLEARQWAALLRPHLPPCLVPSFCDVLNDRLQSDQPFPSRVAFGHGVSPSKGEQTKTRALCAKERRGKDALLAASLCWDTVIPREDSFPPSWGLSYFQYTTKWDHHTFIQVGVRKTMAGSQKDPV